MLLLLTSCFVVAACCLDRGDLFLESLDFTVGKWECLLILAGMDAICRIATLVVLRYVNHNKR